MYLLLGAFIAILLAIVLKVFYKLWFQSKLVMVKDDIKSEKVKDYIIFEYTLGGYMDMVNLSIPVLPGNCEMYQSGGYTTMSVGDSEGESQKRTFFIGYEVEANSGKFFVYGKMKAQDGEIRFSTFFGKSPCRFIVFTDESNTAFVPDNKKIKILGPRESVDKANTFTPWFWQEPGRKIFFRIRVNEDNKLIPYAPIAPSFGGQFTDF
ncbi:MAG: hypothetical protein PHG82_04195 [Candidatus Gracilibacteria bacterium]|nr:hypothetical protein [Candidatus Gracilibacteria bacterium]